MSILAEQLDLIEQASAFEIAGTVTEVRGLAVRVVDLPVPVGAMVRIATRGGRGGAIDGEVVGFDQDHAIVMPLGSTVGVGRGDAVTAQQATPFVRVGRCVLGRVLNAMGQPIDGKGSLLDTSARPLVPRPVDPLSRPLIDEPLATGVRAIDALLSVGRGQRVGVFASPGLGKSTLLGTMARHTAADVSVVALVGERGREVRDFIDNQLGDQGLARSVVVCATGDEPVLLRIRAALVATAIAEYFRDAGLDVLLLMDSVTRLAQAQRQVGLAAGEPPATKGYPPSVFAMLPTLLERSGRTMKGSITGFYAVLIEGDELTDPITDATRGILDGHIMLTEALAQQGHWPAIDVVRSISRVADDVTDADHRAARQQVIRLIAAYRQVEDLVNIGAYAAGSNPDFDLAIAAKPVVDQLLRQGRNEVRGAADFAVTRKQLLALTQQIDAGRQQLSKGQPRKPIGPRA
jgi:flagellum-specific ATP synthase